MGAVGKNFHNNLSEELPPKGSPSFNIFVCFLDRSCGIVMLCFERCVTHEDSLKVEPVNYKVINMDIKRYRNEVVTANVIRDSCAL